MTRSTLLAASLFLGLSQASCGPDCSKLQAEANALVSEYERCKAGDECVVVNLPGGCTGAFSCSAAFNKAGDQAAFFQRAREIEDEYKGCKRCDQAGCIDPPKTAACNVATGRCEFR